MSYGGEEPYLEAYFFINDNDVFQITFIVSSILFIDTLYHLVLPVHSFMLLYFECFVCFLHLFLHLFIHLILTPFLVNMFQDFYCIFIDFNVFVIMRVL